MGQVYHGVRQAFVEIPNGATKKCRRIRQFDANRAGSGHSLPLNTRDQARSSASADDALLQGQCGSLGAVAHVQLGADVIDVIAYSVLADLQDPPDLLVG